MAVIFDMDGVLLDSEPLWQEAEIEVFRSVGVPLTVELCLQTMGLRVDEVVAHWRIRHPWSGETSESVADRLLRKVRELVLERAVPLPGAIELVGHARDRAVAVGLATSSPPLLIEAVVERLGLAGAFDAVCSAADEELGKPHPGVYLTTAAALGVVPTACVAIEDSVNGVVSAKAARMRCLAVPDRNVRDDPRFCLADEVVESLLDAGPALDRLLGAGAGP